MAKIFFLFKIKSTHTHMHFTRAVKGILKKMYKKSPLKFIVVFKEEFKKEEVFCIKFKDGNLILFI